MRKTLLIIASLYLISCSQSSENKSKDTTTENIKPKDILTGQWVLDINNVDKNINSNSSREENHKLDLKKIPLKVLNLSDYTFFGNGEGVLMQISSKSNAGAITSKQFEDISFKYLFDGKYISLKSNKDKNFVKFFKIVDKGINNDYLEVIVIPFNDSTQTYGLYKTGNYQ